MYTYIYNTNINILIVGKSYAFALAIFLADPSAQLHIATQKDT